MINELIYDEDYMLQQDLKKRGFVLYLIVFSFICSSHSNVMYCTGEHNIILCRDVLFENLYKYKKGSPQWNETWRKIADILSKCAIPSLMLTTGPSGTKSTSW